MPCPQFPPKRNVEKCNTPVGDLRDVPGFIHTRATSFGRELGAGVEKPLWLDARVRGPSKTYIIKAFVHLLRTSGYHWQSYSFLAALLTANNVVKTSSMRQAISEHRNRTTRVLHVREKLLLVSCRYTEHSSIYVGTIIG